MTAESSARELLAAIEVERGRLREVVSGLDAVVVAARPANGNWSVSENLRHLLFAEQLHLRGIVAGGVTWSPLGLPPTGMQSRAELRGIDYDSEAGIDELMAAWDAVHAAIMRDLQPDAAGAQRALWRNLRHLRAHTRSIERVLRAQEKASK